MIILKLLAYSVERIAFSLKLSAIRYPLSAKACLVLIVIFSALRFNCYAQPVSSAELINNAKLYDGKRVTFEGEVIGDIMVRGAYAWINVNDGQNAIGIWIDRNLTKGITYTGGHRYKGDTVEVTGIFHRACLEHGGDLDIHAQQIKRISQGSVRIEKSDIGKRNLAIGLLGALCIVWILSRLKFK